MNSYTTSDLSLAAYLVLKGLNLISADKKDNGRFEFVLDDVNNVGAKLSLEYLSSDFCKFDNQIRIIKKVLYSKV